MNDMADKFDLQFYQLVVSLHAAAMQQMGKMASPLSGKIERDMIQAKGSIDLLEMLKRKTVGNLTDEEKGLLNKVIFEAQMNYVDEAKKDAAGESAGEKQEEKAAASDKEETEQDEKTSAGAEADEKDSPDEEAESRSD
ncbi:MAG: DUF1844 domain-containing protein [Candidatus Zixiibacteriota bacterium]|nr:MAG: DUF1844 domain-containing protein [candidate division Zixibacteria bacterium]